MIPSGPVTRFAPSPTGYLHLGHILNAIHTWGIARRLGGTVILRVEDHDQGRVRPAYEAALLDDLDWLGLEPDVGQTSAFRAGVCRYRQSDHFTGYEKAANSIGDRTYRCVCTRKEIAAVSGAYPELRYPGTCRARGNSPAAGAGWRVRFDDRAERFADLRLGDQVQNPLEQCGDLLARDRHGNWTYQFAVTVDDLAEGVTLIVRGEDLLASTGRQLALRRLLGGGNPPAFYHHALLRDASGAKLSKTDGSTGIRELRNAGCAAATVLGRAAHQGGLIRTQRRLTVGELPELFPGLG